MNIGFLGAGKVGTALGRHMVQRGVSLAGYASRNPASARAAAHATGTAAYATPAQLLEACDCVFLTVPDDALPGAWAQLRALPLAGKRVCHCSGLLSSAVFAGAEGLGAAAYAVHPMLAVPSREAPAQLFEGACFTVEGSAAHLDEICGLLDTLGNAYQVIDKDKKPLYHAACVTVSNLVNGLCRVGEGLFMQCGLDADFSQKAWHSLFLSQAQNICSSGTGPSLTGPIERGDANTVHTHLECLDAPAKDIYRLLSRMLVSIAEEKHPGRDYATIKKELLS
ncbi:MAG: Rossmann-like and DUF2520 domain-containing protein [Oscillospiraceae bacterium]